MKQGLIDDTHKSINIAVLQMLIQAMDFTTLFAIWFCHWSVTIQSNVVPLYVYQFKYL